MQMGLKRVGQLYGRDRKALQARFGASLWSSGSTRRWGGPRSGSCRAFPLAERYAEQRFAEPIGLMDDVLMCTRDLGIRLSLQLEAEGLGAQSFHLFLYRVDHKVMSLSVNAARATRDAGHIARLFQNRVERLVGEYDAGFGIDMIRLAAGSVAPVESTQLGAFETDDGAANLDRLYDRMTSRLGPLAVVRSKFVNTHIPERAVTLEPLVARTADDPVADAGSTPPRPLRLLPAPEPIAVTAEVPDGPPAGMVWRRVNYRFEKASGPERIGVEWWRPGEGALTRDYYVAEDDGGRRFWVFREGLYDEDRCAALVPARVLCMNTVVPLPPRQARHGSAAPPPAYAELMVTSNFSFLCGGSHPEELVACAAATGLTGMGLCDRNSFAGVVRGFTARRDLQAQFPNFRYLVGTRLCFADGTPDIITYPADRAAYGRLCKLLSIGNAKGEKGNARLGFDDLLPFTEGQFFIVRIDESRWQAGEDSLARLAALAPGRVWLAGYCTYLGEDRARLNRLADLGRRCKAPMLAVNDVLYHTPGRRVLQDALTCIRQHLTIVEAGRRLEQNAERHLKSPEEMARLFREHPQAIAETQALVSRIGFKLEDLKYNYPEETVGNGETRPADPGAPDLGGSEEALPRGHPLQGEARRGQGIAADRRKAVCRLLPHRARPGALCP
jgi:hypothetical protein